MVIVACESKTLLISVGVVSNPTADLKEYPFFSSKKGSEGVAKNMGIMTSEETL